MPLTEDTVFPTPPTVGPNKAGGVSGAELLVDTLIRLGCRHIFNITGLGMHSLVAALYRRRAEIGYVSHLNESNLALMAQGYARQTRKPAFCIVYQASGTAFALVSLTTAWADRAPLVLISTSASRTVSGRDAYAGLPRSVIEMGAQFTKWSYEVTTASRIPEVLARAYAIAQQPPMGPVHISIPCDLYDEIVDGPLRRADFARTRMFVEDCADEAGLTEVAAMLAGAERPLLLAGSEIGQLGAVDALVALAELLGAPVLLEDSPSYMSFPTSHPQYVGGIGANAGLIADADAVFSIGVEFSEIGHASERPRLAVATPLAIMSVDPLDTTKQYWPDIAVSGHPKPSLRRLIELLERTMPAPALRDQRLTVCTALRTARREGALALQKLDRQVSPIPPAQLIEEVRAFCGQDWIVLQGASTAGFRFDGVFEMDVPADFHGLSGKGSAQGWAAPVSIGVQLAAPERRVLSLIGDGNLMFSATALWAAAKNRLPVVFVVANNSGWASIPLFMRKFGDFTTDPGAGDEMGWTFGEAPIDYVSLARGLGLQAARASTAAELALCLAQAADSDQPWLIDAATAFEDF